MAAPLAYNFLSIAHLQDSNFIDVSSSNSFHLVLFLSTPKEVFIDLMQVMGAMETKELGKKFMIGFPVLVVVLCLATMFNVYSKIGAICCIKSLRYPFSPPLFLFYLFISTLKIKKERSYENRHHTICLTFEGYRPDNDELLVDAGKKILAEGMKEERVDCQSKLIIAFSFFTLFLFCAAREIKEGRGPVQMTTKETIKSSIRQEVRDVNKLSHNLSEDRFNEKVEKRERGEEGDKEPRSCCPFLFILFYF